MTAASDRLDLGDFVGRSGPVVEGRDPVSPAMIRHWCEVIGDANPAYRDTAQGGQIAPPAMLQVWTMPGFDPARRADPLTETLYARLDALGYTSVVATDCEQRYQQALRPGDRVAAVRTITSISAEKRTRLGPGVFVTSAIAVTRAAGETVGTHLHRVLKFRPQPAATPAPAAAVPEAGAAVASLVVPITSRFIVAAAILSRDFEDIHHDPDAARSRGARDIFTNVVTSNGLVARLATDWAGPQATLRRIAIRLGGQNHPGDTLTLTATLARRTATDSGQQLGLDVLGSNERGVHVLGEVDIDLPAGSVMPSPPSGDGSGRRRRSSTS